ncbi:hypothetical protein IT774_07615 [Salinimonas marina]|uniref:Uncharacterized protein n=1 Tax=Salinimonas marina TaxID=2785918 RepID=A0A7S9DZZ9_9ALTE|nr:hypothetical protein [Salinimonas marina]QPG06962.1 hypothetical protein IT774_07615 [Salinimonas marina]
MLLSDFFDHLSYGELSQLAIGTNDVGAIAEKDYPRVTTFVNGGMTLLHTMLRLKVDQVLLQTNALQSRYVLSKQFAVSQSEGVDAGINQYILDEVMPFQDNVLAIETVVNSEGEPFSINDTNDPASVFTPNHREIQFYEPKDAVVAVTYQANHPKIKPYRGMNPDEIELNIPDYCIDILANYCVTRMLGGGNSESRQLAQMYQGLISTQIAQIEQQGLIQPDIPSNQRIWKDKWV